MGPVSYINKLDLPLCKHDSLLLLRLAINWTDSWRLASNSRHQWTWHPFLLQQTLSQRGWNNPRLLQTHSSRRILLVRALGEMIYLPCSLRSPLYVVEKSLGTRRAATKMASPPNFHHHFHCYFGHSWSHFTAERSQRTHCHSRKYQTCVHRFTPAGAETAASRQFVRLVSLDVSHFVNLAGPAEELLL